MLRSDQEPALHDLVGEAARLRADLPTVLEATLVGDSQSDGFIERAVRSVDEMIRTHKIALGAKIGEKLNISHTTIGWMIKHCADTLNKCQVGELGEILLGVSRARSMEELSWSLAVLSRCESLSSSKVG